LFNAYLLPNHSVDNDNQNQEMHVGVCKYIIPKRILPTCFGFSCGDLQGGALGSTDISKYYRSFEPMHRYKILNFKNNTYT